MMTTRWMIAAACGLTVVLSGCNGGGAGNNSSAAAGGADTSAPPVKRQPGSWKTKIDIVRFEDPSAPPGAKEQAQALFNMMGAMSICITPEAAAKEDAGKAAENMGGNKNCTFERKNIYGETIDFVALCTDAGGKKTKVTAKGTSGATAQDMNMVVEPADGVTKGVMEMHITSSRSGDCKPGDITPPASNTN
jgi:hypothetical protein